MGACFSKPTIDIDFTESASMDIELPSSSLESLPKLIKKCGMYNCNAY